MVAINRRSLTISLQERLARPVDGASIAVFRMAFGAIVLWDVAMYLRRDLIGAFWIDPIIHFTYPGFDWVRPLAADGMYMAFILLAAAAAGIMLGLWYRAAVAIFFVGFTYQFLLEKARYLNHYYLISLLALLLVLIPAHRVWSLDRWYTRIPGVARATTVPGWSLLLLRFQVAVVYVFGGIAKLDADWLSGASLRVRWESQGGPLVRTMVDLGLDAPVFGWGGMLFDLLVVPALLWRRTRAFAFAAAVFFHLANSQLFSIGTFPLLAIAATTLFFDPDWPRRLLARISGAAAAASETLVGEARPLSRLGSVALVAYAAVQLLLPFRHLLYPGDVDWTMQGQRFSWRMMLQARQGDVRLLVHAGDDTVRVRPSDYMPDWQRRAMSRDPSMIIQFARYVADDFRPPTGGEVRVYADAFLSLNGRRPVRFIDLSVDLAAQSPTFWSASEILTTTSPPPPPPSGGPRSIRGARSGMQPLAGASDGTRSSRLTTDRPRKGPHNRSRRPRQPG